LDLGAWCFRLVAGIFFISTTPASLSSPSSLPFVHLLTPHLLLAALPLSLLAFLWAAYYFFSAAQIVRQTDQKIYLLLLTFG
jgi:hypothetical protein